MKDKTFRVTKEHIKLLQSAYMGWDDCEFGAPAIDCKRPYGNSYVYGDIADLLNIEPDGEEPDGFSDEQMSYMLKIHTELETVLQILTNCLAIKEGWYEYADDYKWFPVPAPNPPVKKFEIRGVHSLNYFAVVEAKNELDARLEADTHNLLDDNFWHDDPDSWRFEVVGVEELEDE